MLDFSSTAMLELISLEQTELFEVTYGLFAYLAVKKCVPLWMTGTFGRPNGLKVATALARISQARCQKSRQLASAGDAPVAPRFLSRLKGWRLQSPSLLSW